MALLKILSLPTYVYMQLIFWVLKILNRISSFLKFSGITCVVGHGNICFEKIKEKAAENFVMTFLSSSTCYLFYAFTCIQVRLMVHM
jgi:hypothetical protein